MESFSERLRMMFSATHVDEAYVVHRIVTVCTDMLRDRGCAHVDATSDFDAVVAHMERNEPVVVGGPHPSTRVFFHTDDRISVKAMRTTMEDCTFDKTIFVSFEGPTTFASREAVSAWGASVQFFRFRDLSYNVTHHALVPKHARYDVAALGGALDVATFPRLLASDPVAQYYDFAVGDVVRISRTHMDGQTFDYFRLVAA